MKRDFHALAFLFIFLFIGCTSNCKKNQVLIPFHKKNQNHVIYCPVRNLLISLKGNQITTYQFKTQAFKNIKRNRAIDVAGRWVKIHEANFNFPKSDYVFSLGAMIGLIHENEVLFYHLKDNEWQQNKSVTLQIPHDNKGLIPFGNNGIGVVKSNSKMDYFTYSYLNGWRSIKNINIPNIKDGVIPIPDLLVKEIAVYDKLNKSIEICKYDIESSFWRIEIERSFQVPEKFDDIFFWDFKDENQGSRFWSAPGGYRMVF